MWIVLAGGSGARVGRASSPDKATLFSIFAFGCELESAAAVVKWICSIILWPHHQAGYKELRHHTQDTKPQYPISLSRHKNMARVREHFYSS